MHANLKFTKAYRCWKAGQMVPIMATAGNHKAGEVAPVLAAHAPHIVNRGFAEYADAGSDTVQPKPDKPTRKRTAKSKVSKAASAAKLATDTDEARSDANADN